ncbi:hypothetical protein [Cerasicoccus frondis]|uniref:hypothetical protein n=1 Tax=Cerasicoccus frondis TaxID=490090 RepID=UPI0028527375|nr:hypothetical protein [Cerasicoccus frondis]
MSVLIKQRCRIHGHREAVARCPECEKFFCRECVTEHDGRVICQSCLTSLLSEETKEASPVWGRALSLLGAGVGFLLAWWVFYLIGRTLLSIPSEFHDGSFLNY